MRPVLAIVSDLVFRAKIDAVCRQLGLELRVARSPEQLDRHLAQGSPAVTLVDLETAGLDVPGAIRTVKRAAPDTAVVGVAGHTNAAAFHAARDAGADELLARSAFQSRLPILLTRIAGEERARSARLPGAADAGR